MNPLLNAAATLLVVLFGAVLCLIDGDDPAATETIARATRPGDLASG